ncbi:16S rRNA (guanine(1207)-N(2))-methyltransferase RsmC [Buchnera aphidicola]|uniref:16S rRNA (guanine(1207)-N(2))-methyltransferase RsmC n=1 Tax=Buchnera aphidicola TaxID=9 RepID=UPI00094C6FD9|nr:16S rRNA (guanine(1207)-N(2))-methyltransferase RsmC [Buchnera aphidicola]
MNDFYKKKYLSKESQILLKNFNIIKNHNVIFSGIIPDKLSYILTCKKFIIYAQKYNIYNIVNKKIHQHIIFHQDIHKKIFFQYNCLVYFWPKDKKEAKFQLIYLFSIIKKNFKIYIIGKNNSGINGIKKIFINFINFIKIDFARNCVLYHGILKKKIPFVLKNFVKKYTWHHFVIYHLPGVFGYNGIDQGSLLLISTFNNKINGNILDLCSGSGILSVALSYFAKNITLTLTDIYDSAIWSSKKTLKTNKIEGYIYKSDIYSNITGKFDFIISNPPIHNNLKVNINIIRKIVKHSKKYLKNNGKLRIVTNSMISYQNIFKKYFNKYDVILKTKKYKIYQVTCKYKN